MYKTASFVIQYRHRPIDEQMSSRIRCDLCMSDENERDVSQQRFCANLNKGSQGWLCEKCARDSDKQRLSAIWGSCCHMNISTPQIVDSYRGTNIYIPSLVFEVGKEKIIHHTSPFRFRTKKTEIHNAISEGSPERQKGEWNLTRTSCSPYVQPCFILSFAHTL